MDDTTPLGGTCHYLPVWMSWWVLLHSSVIHCIYQ